MNVKYNTNNSDESSELPPLTWELLQEGATLEGDNGCPPGELPPWLDRERFYKGQQTCREYFALALFGTFGAFTIGMSDKQIYTMFSSLESHQNPRSIGRRYLGTSQHLMKWFDTDVLDKQSEGHRSILAVRCYHKLYMKKFENQLGEHPEGHLWLSQKYMALVLHSMIILLAFKPYGISICTDEELDEITYFWRVLGYLLGISDRYNICRSGAAGLRNLTKEIAETQLLPRYTSMTTEMKTLGQVAADSVFATFVHPVPVFNPMIGLIVNVQNNLGLSTPEMIFTEKLSWFEWAHVKLLVMFFSYGIHRWRVVRSLFNAAVRLSMKFADAEALSNEPFPKASEPAETFVCPISLKSK